MKRQDRYWICNLCALKKDLHQFKTGNTLIMSLCGWCDHPDESLLTPLCDLKTSSGKSGYFILRDKGQTMNIEECAHYKGLVLSVVHQRGRKETLSMLIERGIGSSTALALVDGRYNHTPSGMLKMVIKAVADKAIKASKS